MIDALKTWLSRKLCPDVHRESGQYHRLRGQISMYEQWLGTSHPEAAAVLYQLAREDCNYAGEYDHDRAEELRKTGWWRAPGWVWGVSEFREWLDRKPFEGRVQ